MKVTICDCCGGKHNVRRTRMYCAGVREAAIGDIDPELPDLCESCRVSLAFKWGELSKGGTDG